MFHLRHQALVATIMELKARAGTIFRNCEKSNNGNPRACMFHLRHQALVAPITEIKARAAPFFVIVGNVMMGTPGKGDKSAIQNK